MKVNFDTSKDSFSIPRDYNEIFDLDESIRFVGMCSNQGRLLDVKYRNEIMPLLSDRELLYSIVKSVERINTRKESEGKLGPALYSVTAYANVKRATIPADGDLLFVSFERNGNEFKILNKILKQIEIAKS